MDAYEPVQVCLSIHPSTSLSKMDIQITGWMQMDEACPHISRFYVIDMIRLWDSGEVTYCPVVCLPVENTETSLLDVSGTVGGN